MKEKLSLQRRFNAISLFLYFLIFTLVSKTQGFETVNYDETRKNIWAMLVFSIESGIGIALNLLSLDLFRSLNDPSKISFYGLNLALNGIDLLFVFAFFLKSTLSYATGSYFGGIEQDKFCLYDTYMNGTFVVWSVNIIVGISYLARVYLCYGWKLTNNQLLAWVIGSAIYGALNCAAFIYIPNGGYGLVSSGVYCFLKPTVVDIPVAFTMSLLIPLCVLSYNLFYVRKAIMASQKVLTDLGMNGQAKGNFILMVKKLGVFLLAIAVCEFPLLVMYLYELISGQNASVGISTFAGFIAVANSAITNPLLFIYLNVDLQEKLFMKYGHIIKFVIQLVYTKRNRINPLILLVRNEKATLNDSLMSPGKRSLILVDYENWECWLNDDILKKAFHEYGAKEYVMENLSFYDAIKQYHMMAKSCDGLRYHGKELVNSNNENFLKIWNEVNLYIDRLYKVYIKVPTAPLEININTSTRNTLLEILFKVNISENNVQNNLFEGVHSPRTMETTLNITESPNVSPRIKQHVSLYISPKTCDVVRPFLSPTAHDTKAYSTNTIPSPTNVQRENFQQSNSSNVNNLEIILPDLSNKSNEEIKSVVEMYMTAFDECLEVISDIIAGDIWPRFRKSTLYNSTKQSHQSGLLV